MTVAHEQIEMPVVVRVEKPRAKTKVVQAEVAEAGLEADLRVKRAVVAIQPVVFQLVVGDEQVKVAILVYVAGIDAHTRLASPVCAQRGPGHQAGLGKGAIALVDVVEIGRQVVGYVEVGVAIPVEVARHRAQPIAGVLNTRLRANCGKDAVALVAVENVLGRRELPRVAVEAQPQVLATAPRLFAQGKAHVLRGKEVEIAVEIVVKCNGAGGPSRVSESGCGRRIHIAGPGASVELIRPISRQVKVWAAIAIVVGRSNPHAIVSAGRASRAVHPSKGAPIVAKELVRGRAPPPLQVPAVDQVQIPIAIPVVIEKGTARAIGLG